MTNPDSVSDVDMQDFCMAVYKYGGSQLDYSAARRAIEAIAPRLKAEGMREAAEIAENCVEQECCGKPRTRVISYSEWGEPLDIEQECCGNPNITPLYPDEVASRIRARADALERG